MAAPSSAHRRFVRVPLAVLALAVVAVVAGVWLAARGSRLPDALDMGSDAQAMAVAPGGAMVHGAPTPLAALDRPSTGPPTRRFELVAARAPVDVGGRRFDGLAFNGRSPGPELRVRQGDRVEVRLVNRDVAEGVSIHWHGVAVPNPQDGVPGVTQDAVRPGQSFTYGFTTEQAGTFIYHSHQVTDTALPAGLYGALVVEPPTPTADVDVVVALHERVAPNLVNHCEPPLPACAKVLEVDGQAGAVRVDARPGARVRLRLVDAGQDQHRPVLVGAPFRVVALDGNDVNGPQELRDTALPIASGQRYDLAFTMPTDGAPVALIDHAEKGTAADQFPSVTFGSGPPPAYPAGAPVFDFTNYGTPAADPLLAAGSFDASYDLELGDRLGFHDGGFTRLFTINGQVAPDVAPLAVAPGQRVKVRLSEPAGGGGDLHPMHLHGHTFTVLSKNGQPLTGSPIRMDTLPVGPGEAYEVAFEADNPGLWMFHCHIANHAARGMSTMVDYPNIATPFRAGRASANTPE